MMSSRFLREILKFIKTKNNFTKKNYLKKINSKLINKKIIEFKKPKLGLIGERPEGFDTCDFNNEELKSKFNVKITKIKLQSLFNISSKIDKKEISVTKKNKQKS